MVLILLVERGSLGNLLMCGIIIRFMKFYFRRVLSGILIFFMVFIMEVFGSVVFE